MNIINLKGGTSSPIAPICEPIDLFLVSDYRLPHPTLKLGLAHNSALPLATIKRSVDRFQLCGFDGCIALTHTHTDCCPENK